MHKKFDHIKTLPTMKVSIRIEARKTVMPPSLTLTLLVPVQLAVALSVSNMLRLAEAGSLYRQDSETG